MIVDDKTVIVSASLGYSTDSYNNGVSDGLGESQRPQSEGQLLVYNLMNR